ncbi:MAG: hemerythrin domain-containing protein [Deltaproteobacteria bacterium]|nr:hemerythrin domain-containing protein [Deltaproteobacteria bacterium]
MEPETPSQIRERVLAQHDLLRLRLQGLAQGVDRLRAGKLPVEDLRILAWETLALLRAHVKDEERWLLPALREADGFGPARVDALREEHAAQAEEMSATLDELKAAKEADALADGVEGLVQRILDDMDEEEATYLSPNLLKDDLVTTGFIG